MQLNTFIIIINTFIICNKYIYNKYIIIYNKYIYYIRAETCKKRSILYI
jgi:hypothetical protein